jgi:hypothetical protein
MLKRHIEKNTLKGMQLQIGASPDASPTQTERASVIAKRFVAASKKVSRQLINNQHTAQQ